jgi:hypothetical protein
MSTVSAISKARRLLAALDELAGTEEILLGAGQGGRALAAHQRAAPLLAELIPLIGDPAVTAALQPRLAAWLERRRENWRRARQLRTRLLEEGARIAGARMRLARLLPAYHRGGGGMRSSRLTAAV